MNSSGTRLSAIYAALFGVLCISLVYLPEWLSRSGFSTAQIGLVLAGATWLKVPMTLLAGNLADQLGRRKRVLIFIAAMFAAGLPLLFAARGFWQVWLVWALLGALVSTLVPLCDSISVTGVRRDGLSYGRMRMWGSLSFLLISIVGGIVVKQVGKDAVVYLLLAGAVLLCVFSWHAPDYESRRPSQRGLSISPALMSRVFKVPGFSVFLFAAAMSMASHAALYSLSTVRWSAAGISLPVIGSLWSTGVVAEIAIFYVSARLVTRISPWYLLLIAAITGVVRWSLMAVVVDIVALFFIQTLHAITFTFTQLAVVNFIARHIPEELISSAQTIYDSFALGIIFGVALFISGQLSAINTALPFFAMATMCAGSAVVAAIFITRMKEVA